jgi:hypothetical protein
VEPILNPGQELQAVGRIHRIGQKRSTVIHRYDFGITEGEGQVYPNRMNRIVDHGFQVIYLRNIGFPEPIFNSLCRHFFLVLILKRHAVAVFSFDSYLCG